MSARKTYRVNADSWTVLQQLLVATPEEFNPDLSRRWVTRGGWSGWKYTGALRGRQADGQPLNGWITRGQMPDEHWTQLADSVVNYVIYSYETPIAYRRIADWNGNGTANYEWIVPDAKYSRTTSKHQGKVKTALSQISGGI